MHLSYDIFQGLTPHVLSHRQTRQQTSMIKSGICAIINRLLSIPVEANMHGIA